MKAPKFTNSQRMFIVKQGSEGAPVSEICRKAEISQATYCQWVSNTPATPIKSSWTFANESLDELQRQLPGQRRRPIVTAYRVF